MPRYKMMIEYDGTAYNGWQIQPKGTTIQGTIQQALSQILTEPVTIAGQGRTDSGVHAEGQVAHFDFDRSIDTDQLLYALLGVLPRDISVWEMEKEAPDFHARFDGKARQYRYQIVTRPAAISYRYATLVLDELDIKEMKQCAALILGEHDFENFTKADADQKDAICEVFQSEFICDDYRITYRIKANRFVRHMVRRLVGSMLEVGKGRKTFNFFEQLLNKPEKKGASYGIKGKGLILEKVEY